MERKSYTFQEELDIRNIFTFYYKELANNFLSSGNFHDFWKFSYIDKGQLEVTTESNRFILNQGDIIFYKPRLFHRGRASGGTAPNQIIVSFECSAPCMRLLEDRVFRLDEWDRSILSHLVSEGQTAFDPPIASPSMRKLERRREAPFGCDQLMKNYLEIFLIRIIRQIRRNENMRSERMPSIPEPHLGNGATKNIVRFLQDHLSSKLSPEQISRQFGISRTSLHTMFKSEIGLGVMEYLNRLRIDQAKSLIRERQLNFTQIADATGFDSLHYFSKQFKHHTGMSPTEYARSVKALSLRDTQK